MGLAAAEAQFHVLAVDDCVIDRKLIETLLKKTSYHVTTVDSGSKALEFLGWNEGNSDEAIFSPKNNQEVEVNLIITDYCMPGMTGYDLLKKIKESAVLRDIPVVIMSSENVPSRINRCLEEGAEEFFLKPVRLADVNKLKPHIMKTMGRETLNHENQDNDEEIAETEIHSQQQQTAQSNTNNNKRKSMDEGLSPDRTRPRYDTIMVSLLCPTNLLLFFIMFFFFFKNI